MPPSGRRTITRTPRQSAPVTHAENGRRLDYGVRPGAAVAVQAALLVYDRDTPQPFCTCSDLRRGYGFDPQIGLYLHVACWKPSKAMYAAALEAGVLEPPIERGPGDEVPETTQKFAAAVEAAARKPRRVTRRTSR